MKSCICALTIGGSDSGCCSGIQADLKTFSALGVYAATAVTAVVASSTQGVKKVAPVPVNVVREQILTVMRDLSPWVVKVGMLYNARIARGVADELSDWRKILGNDLTLVLDPVMLSNGAETLISDDALAVVRQRLLPLADLLTPNLAEAALLTGKDFIEPSDDNAITETLRQLRGMGAKNVLLKGGKGDAQRRYDWFINAEGVVSMTGIPNVETPNQRGVGATLASAICAFLAQEKPMPEAVRLGLQYTWHALQAGAQLELGFGPGPLNHFFNPKPLIQLGDDTPPSPFSGEMMA